MRAPYAARSATSEAAAESIESNRDALCRRILDAVTLRGSTGMTCDEIEVALDLAHQTASARVWELRHAGCIAETSEDRRTRSGRKATVIIATGKPFDAADVPKPVKRELWVVRGYTGAIISVVRVRATDVSALRTACERERMTVEPLRTIEIADASGIDALVQGLR